MASPYTYGSVTVMPNGPGQSTDNITALGSATALGLGNINNGSVWADVLVPPIVIETGTSATTGGTIGVYIITSEDGTHWTDGISPTSTSNQKSKIVTALPAAVINAVVANSTYYIPEFSILSVLGFPELPLNVGIVIDNETGGAFHATASNFSANYLPITWT